MTDALVGWAIIGGVVLLLIALAVAVLALLRSRRDAIRWPDGKPGK